MVISTKLIYMFRLIDRSLCPPGSLHAMNYFVSFGDFYTSGRQDAEVANITDYNRTSHKQSMNNNYMQFLSCNISSSKLSLNFFLHSQQHSTYSRTCIKWHHIKQSSSIKRSAFKVPKISSLYVLHHLRSPNKTKLIFLLS